MHSYQSEPSSPTTKRAPMPLNLNTSSRYNAHDATNSPPRTPISGNRLVKSAGALRALMNRPTPRETFLDDLTPVETFKASDTDLAGPRDSHDLSLASLQATRDSLVDNMLLSL